MNKDGQDTDTFCLELFNIGAYQSSPLFCQEKYNIVDIFLKKTFVMSLTAMQCLAVHDKDSFKMIKK